jgi:hypothetical protein
VFDHCANVSVTGYFKVQTATFGSICISEYYWQHAMVKAVMTYAIVAAPAIPAPDKRASVA